MGIILFQLLSGKTPFDAKNLRRIGQNICNKDVNLKNLPSKITDQAKDFLL